jgi:radical SAM protein with 4Fe4S-binding SPASM domain
MRSITEYLSSPDLTQGSTSEWYPELVSWNISKTCNLRCSHCYLDAGERGPGELSLEESYRLIDQLAAAGNHMLILTGGEPLMRRDIEQLAQRATAKGLLVVLGTNGMLLTPQRVKSLQAAGVAGAGISLDSLDTEKHDGFRGVPGAWKGAVRGIRECVTQGLPVLLQMTALPWNYQEISDMVAFAHSEGVTGFTLYFLVCTGRGEQLSDITPRQYEEALASLVEAQQHYPDMMVRARCAPQIARLASQQESALMGNAGCLAARQYCRITPEGDVTPCPYLPLAAGSVRDRSFGDIWQSAPIFQRLRQETPGGKCGVCDFREACGGCRARAFALTGDLAGEDPWCGYQPIEFVTPTKASPPVWTHDAEQRLHRIPAFIRGRVKMAVERHAQSSGKAEITPAEMTATLEGMGRRIPFKRPQGAGQTKEGDGSADAG